jgi:hypothetical protein
LYYRWKKSTLTLSILFVIGWLATIGVAEWFYAMAEVEPPAWDAFSHSMKAFYFWQEISHGRFGNLLALVPSLRPPGTVLMSYPFGFSVYFQAFYFRSVFFPLVLLVGAVYIVGYCREMPDAAKWLLAVLALAMGGMPILFQFQGNDLNAAAVTWGLVDNFLAGVAAVAVASCMRSARTHSTWWAVSAILAAAFCFMIKPTGLLVMALVGASWLLLISFQVRWNLFRLWQESVLRRYCVIWLITAGIIYGSTIITAFSSPYMGAANLASGAATVAVLRGDFALPINVDTVSRLSHLSFGYPLLVLIGLGLIASMTIREERGAAAAAGICLATGIWFWFLTGTSAQVRYVLPFGVMAFIILVPSLLHTISYLPAWLRVGAAVAIMAPTAAISLLLLIPQPPTDWQRLLGINLSTGVFRAEDEQAVALLSNLQEEGTQSASVYLIDLSGFSPARAFEAVLSYWTFVNSTLPKVTVQRPVSWQSGTTYRLNDIALMDYVVFSPIRDDKLRQLLDLRSVPDLKAENLIMEAWFSSLTPADGVDMVSETRVRLLRIADRGRFQEALQRLSAAYDWRAEFRAANPGP